MIFILKCIRNMNFSDFFATLKQLKKESGKNYFWLLLDVVYSGFRYGAGFNDYRLCQFYRLPSSVRKTYVTRGVNQKLAECLTDPTYTICFNDKRIFYRIYNGLLGRKWVSINEAKRAEALDFLNQNEAVMIKPAFGTGGAGIQKVNRADFQSVGDMLSFIQSQNVDIMEAYIVQHENMAQMNASSVNTIRVVTILQNGKAGYVYAYLRMGIENSIVDNLHAGGVFAPIDLISGKITHSGYSKNQITYACHPQSGVSIQGFQIPCWEKVLQLCSAAATLVPQMRYVGWDVAIDQSGNAILIEGNHMPGYDFLQMPPHMDTNIGMLPHILSFLSESEQKDFS